MPAGKSSESHAMLYTLVTFVALFLIAAIGAGIYYAKAEEYRTQYDEQKKKLDEVAGREQGNLAKIVGKNAEGKSALGTMELYLNQMIMAITGQESADLSAAAKVNEVAIQLNKLLEGLGDDRLTVAGQEGITLLGQIGFLKTRLDEERTQTKALQAKIDELLKGMDQQQKDGQEHEKNLIAEKDRYQQQANEVQKQYDALKTLMEQSTEQQVQNIMATLDKTKKELADKNGRLRCAEQTAPGQGSGAESGAGQTRGDQAASGYRGRRVPPGRQDRADRFPGQGGVSECRIQRPCVYGADFLGV